MAMFEFLSNVWKWMNDNGGALGAIIPLLIALIAVTWSFLSYLSLKKKDLHQKRMELYHNLIYRLVARDPTKGLYLDSQIAIVYE